MPSNVILTPTTGPATTGTEYTATDGVLTGRPVVVGPMKRRAAVDGLKLRDEHRAGGPSERIAARRARTAANIASFDKEQAELAMLAKTVAKYGEDAVQDARTDAMEANLNPTAFAYKRSRGYRANTNRADAARRAREDEFVISGRRISGTHLKYAAHKTAGDPTGQAATTVGPDRLLLMADSFTFLTRGRRGVAVDFPALAAAIGTDDVNTVKSAVVGALDSARPGDLVKRGRAVGMGPGDLHIASRDHVANIVGRPVAIAVESPTKLKPTPKARPMGPIYTVLPIGHGKGTTVTLPTVGPSDTGPSGRPACACYACGE